MPIRFDVFEPDRQDAYMSLDDDAIKQHSKLKIAQLVAVINYFIWDRFVINQL